MLDAPVAIPSPVAQVLQRVAPRGLFALVDAARDRSAYELVSSLPADVCRSLYDESPKVESLAAYAPYLVDLVNPRHADPRHADVAGLWGQSCLVFVAAPVPLADLRQHFRRFLLVRTGGKSLYFRFYDPRVLPGFLDNAGARDLAAFRGPVERFILETDGGRAGLHFEADPRGPQGRLIRSILGAASMA